MTATPYLPISTICYAALLVIVSWVVTFAAATAETQPVEKVHEHAVVAQSAPQAAVDAPELLDAMRRLVFFIGH